MTSYGPPILAGGNSDESSVNPMAGAAGVVGLRITGGNGITGRTMTRGAVAVHSDDGIVIDRGMVAHKGAMADRAIIGCGAGRSLFPQGRTNKSTGCPVALIAGVMDLIIPA